MGRGAARAVAKWLLVFGGLGTAIILAQLVRR